MFAAVRLFLGRHDFERLFWAGLASLVLIPAAAAVAATPFWFDELLTVHLARLDSMGDLIGALKDGADVQPLLSYLLTRGSVLIFGESEFAVRLPSLGGFAIACWATFQFTARRAGLAAGAAATFALGVTEGFLYAHEARPYGLWFGFSALALLGWA